MLALFTKHPRSVGETYGEHMVFATGFGARMMMGGLACFIHGFFPFLCVRTGSKTVRELEARMTGPRKQGAPGGMMEPEYLI